MIRKLMLMFWVAALCLSACNLPFDARNISPSAPQAWIDDPLDGMRLPLQPYTLTLHSSDPSGIAEMEVSINGAVLATLPNPNPAQLLVYLTHKWVPVAPDGISFAPAPGTPREPGALRIRPSLRSKTPPQPPRQPPRAPARSRLTPTQTTTGTVTPTPTQTTTITRTPTITPTPTRTPTITQTPTITRTPTRTATRTLTSAVAVCTILERSTTHFYFRLPDKVCSPTTVTMQVRGNLGPPGFLHENILLLEEFHLPDGSHGLAGIIHASSFRSG